MINWNNIKDRFTHLFIYLSRAVFYIPTLLIIYALFCFFGFGTDFIINNEKTLRLIDTALFIISSIHIVKFHKQYFKYQINSYYGCLLFMFLERTDITFHLSNLIYRYSYLAIILFVILKSIKDNRK